MSVATVCPYCNAKLRVSNPKPGAAIRVKCRVCKSHFHPTVAFAPTAAVAPLANQQTDVDATPAPVPDPADAVADDRHERRRARPDATHEMTTPGGQVTDERHERRRARRHAARERLRERQKRTSKSKSLQPVELLLAGALVFGGVAAAGILAWKALAPAEVATSAMAPEEAKPLPEVPIQSVLVSDMNRPLPAKLFGLWDLRTDDVRRGTIEFRSNGTLTARAWLADDERQPFQGKWFVTQENGNEMTVEAGQEVGTPGNLLLTLITTGPESLTVKLSVMNGVRSFEPQRFIRRPDRAPDY